MPTLKIGQRLTLAFAVLLALLSGLSALSSSRFSELSRVTQSIVEINVKRAFLAQAVNTHSQRAATCLLLLLQTSDRERRIALYAEMDGELAAADGAVEAVGNTLSSVDDKAELDLLLALRDTYDENFRQTVEMIEIDGTEKARAHFDAKTQKALDKLLAETSRFSLEQRQEMDVNLAQLQADEAAAQRLIMLLSVGAALGGVLLATVITRSIVVPVKEAVGVAEAIAEGDLDRPVPAGDKDEVGQLLRALTTMRDSIASREQKILRLAYEDPLTGLANRNRFIQTFSELTNSCHGAIVVLDLDRFSLINNALGHDVGDLLLQEVAKRMEMRPTCAGISSQLSSRLWGNQFAFLLRDASSAGAHAFAEGIVDLLRTPVSLANQRLDVGATMGIAIYPQDGNDAAMLLRRAEAAMRLAKRRHSPFEFFAGADNEPGHEQLSLIGEMREALARKEFVAFYQPKLHLASDTVTGAEALLRWQHPTKGLVPPGKFIPFAEQTGFIRDITPWLIELVIRDAAAWRKGGLAIIPSVNLSTHDLLNPNLVTYVADLLTQHGLTPDQLCLEITESALMEDPDIALKHLHELSDLGLKLSIDDYGSGQASLAYLQTLPVNELKIDRAFVMDVHTSRKNSAIVRSTILLCHDLGLTVVGEGAEEVAEIDWLRSAGCDMVQGYGVAKPLPLEKFLDWAHHYPKK